LENPNGMRIEQSLCFTSKLQITKPNIEHSLLVYPWPMGLKQLICLSDSELIVGQVSGTFQVRDMLLMKYYQMVSALFANFEAINIEHILRTSNLRDDILSKLALGKGKARYNTVIRLTLSQPTMSIIDFMNVESAEANWRTSIT